MLSLIHARLYARTHLRQANAICYGIAVINEQERNSRVEHFLSLCGYTSIEWQPSLFIRSNHF